MSSPPNPRIAYDIFAARTARNYSKASALNLCFTPQLTHIFHGSCRNPHQPIFPPSFADNHLANLSDIIALHLLT
ncbi:MAG: hypothetical protein ACRCVV_09865, partial [Shewanella sp.]